MDTYSTGTFTSLWFTVKLERLDSHYVRNLILPNAILLAITCLTFFLPYECGERIGFAMTVTLALCFNLIAVVGFVPESSKSMPNVSIYFLTSISFSALSLIIIFLISFLSTKYDNKKSAAAAEKSGDVYMKDHPDVEFRNSENWFLENPDYLTAVIGTVYFIGTSIFTIVFFFSQ